MTFRPSITVRTKQKVVKEISTSPLVGFEKTEDLPDGWQYDVKRWASPFDLRLPTLPKVEGKGTQGVPETYYLPGVSDKSEDILFESIKQMTAEKTRQWVPTITTGDYFRYDIGYHLFSDNSIIQYASPVDTTDGRNYITLTKEPNVNSTILVASFKREKHINTIIYNKKLTKVNNFTGKYISGEEQETLTSGKQITWANVDTTKREFMITYPNKDTYVAVLNKDYIETHGIELDPLTSSLQDLGACELIGSSNGQEYQVFTLRYFPVVLQRLPEAEDTFHLYVANNVSFEEWARVDNWWELFLTDSYTTNKYFVDRDLGIVYFGSPLCGIPALASKIVVSYESTLRVEYEEEIEKDFLVRAITADVNPVTQATSQGFVCITHKTLEAANITLSIDKNKISGTNPEQHGPIYAGSDYGVLTAKVIDTNGEAVPNVEVSFSLVPDNIGTINGSVSAISGTNSVGKAYTSYQPPTTSDELGWYSTTVEDMGAEKDIIIKSSASALSTANKIYLYHVFKDDPLLGYDSIYDYLDDIYDVDPPAWVENSPDKDVPITGAKARWRAEMILEYNLVDWVQADEGTLPSGRKVIVYKIDYANDTDNLDAAAINPVTGLAGAIMPVYPTSFEKDGTTGFWKLTYPAAAIPAIGTNNIAGYWIVADRVVSVQASCWSPYYNRQIYSNTINIRVAVPDYMLGVYINENLKSIPFGWKIKNEDIVSSVLNTTTFITINPYSGPYEIIDLVNGGSTDTWASAPSRTVNFTFEIEEPI
jgi:hypothetical protein